MAPSRKRGPDAPDLDKPRSVRHFNAQERQWHRRCTGPVSQSTAEQLVAGGNLMETAKVDVRKLQLLNDRINQCLDALNQVRLSVHGLSHTQANPATAGIAGFGGIGAAGGTGAGYIDPRFTDPRFGYGMPPGAQGFGGQGFGGGLAHSPYLPTSAAAFPTPGPLNIGAGMGTGVQAGSPFPAWNQPIGLSHTGLEAESLYNRPLWADPVLAARVAQTFPFVQLGLPPIVPVY
jgi:hypothetical protein